MKPFKTLLISCLGLVSSICSQPADSLSHPIGCDAFCVSFKRVLQERQSHFKKMKKRPNPYNSYGNPFAGIFLSGANICTLNADSEYECSYDFRARVDEANKLFSKLKHHLPGLVPRDWVTRENSEGALEFATSTGAFALRLSLDNTGGGDDPWSGRVYPPNMHILLTIDP